MIWLIKNKGMKGQLGKLVLPIFIETSLVMMLGAVDTVMLSQYSDNSVAAVGVVNQLVNLAVLVFQVISFGTTVLCSQYLGAGLKERMVQATGVAIVLNGVCGLLISALPKMIIWENYSKPQKIFLSIYQTKTGLCTIRCLNFIFWTF